MPRGCDNNTNNNNDNNTSDHNNNDNTHAVLLVTLTQVPVTRCTSRRLRELNAELQLWQLLSESKHTQSRQPHLGDLLLMARHGATKQALLLLQAFGILIPIANDPLHKVQLLIQ